MSNYVDTAALRALMSKATPGPWAKTPHEEKNDVCIWKPDGSWLANVGNWARCTVVVDDELAVPNDIERIEVEHDANAALIVALVNAAPALLDELDALRAENEKLKAREVEVTTDAALAASESFTLRRDSDSMLAEIRRLDAECGRLRAEVDFVRANVLMIADRIASEVKPFGPLYAASASRALDGV